VFGIGIRILEDDDVTATRRQLAEDSVTAFGDEKVVANGNAWVHRAEGTLKASTNKYRASTDSTATATTAAIRVIRSVGRRRRGSGAAAPNALPRW
jgi:hypothetical protein